MLRPEHRGDIHPHGDKRVETVGQVGGDRGGMREQRDALARQRRAQREIGEQAISEGVLTLRLAAMKLLGEGITTASEVIQSTDG